MVVYGISCGLKQGAIFLSCETKFFTGRTFLTICNSP